MTARLLSELAAVFSREAASHRDPFHAADIGGLYAEPRGLNLDEADRLDAIASELRCRSYEAEGEDLCDW